MKRNKAGQVVVAPDAPSDVMGEVGEVLAQMDAEQIYLDAVDQMVLKCFPDDKIETDADGKVKIIWAGDFTKRA